MEEIHVIYDSVPTGTDFLFLPPTYIFRDLKQLFPIVDPSKSVVNQNELLPMRIPPPVFIYGLPGSGKTKLLISLTAQAKALHRRPFVSYMDLKRASKLLADNPEEVWTLPKLIFEYNRNNGGMGFEQVNAFFSPRKINTMIESPIGELFLDGLDTVIPPRRKGLIKILNGVDWSRCGVRVWITSRTHMKTLVEGTFDEEMKTVFELAPLTREQQLDNLFELFKIDYYTRVPDFHLKKAVENLYKNLETWIDKFDKTIGATPFNCKAIKKGMDMIPQFEQSVLDLDVSFSVDYKMLVKIIEHLVQSKRAAYAKKYSRKYRPEASPKEVETECLSLDKLHVKVGISMYPSFGCVSTNAFFSKDADVQYKLYGGGMVFENDGKIQCIHNIYMDFLMEKYYANCGRLKNSGNYYVNFMIVKILFEDEAKSIRKIFNAYMGLQQERGIVNLVIIWTRLQKFICQHYFLKDTLEDKVKHKQIKNKGTVLHKLIMERHDVLLHMVLCSMKGAGNSFTTFLDMTVDIDVFFKNPFQKETIQPEKHNVNALHLLALFGGGKELKLSLEFFLVLMGPKRIKNFLKDGNYTLLHYAAMNSNHLFFKVFFETEKFGVKGRTLDGKLPIHMVIHDEYFYRMKIEDIPHSKPIFTFTNGKTSTPPGAKVRLTGTIDISGTQNRVFFTFEGIQKHFNYFDGRDRENFKIQFRSHILSLVYLFKYQGENINAQSLGDGKTVLHEATIRNSKPVVEFLLKKGALGTVRDSRGLTPPQYAAILGHHELLDLLVQWEQATVDLDEMVEVKEGPVDGEDQIMISET